MGRLEVPRGLPRGLGGSREWSGKWEISMRRGPQSSGLDGVRNGGNRGPATCGGIGLGESGEQRKVADQAAHHGRPQLVISYLYPMIQTILKERVEITYVSSSWGGVRRPMVV